MFIREYLNLKEALGRICKEEKIFKFELNELKAGEIIFWCLGPKEKRIIIVDEGACWLVLEEEKTMLQAERGKGVQVAYVLKGKKCAIIPITDISYTVNGIGRGGLIFRKSSDLAEKLKTVFPEAREIL